VPGGKAGRTGGSRVEEPGPGTIRAAAAGDRAAFEALVRAYQAPVWRFLTHLLGDRALAEDVTQETFLRVHRKLSTFRAGSTFSTWVFQIARNAGIDAVRTRGRQLRLVAAIPRPRPGGDPHPRTELAAALADLSPLLREALLVVEVLGLTYREAGAVLGVPEGTVKSRVFLARERLTAWLRDEEAADEV
jgi:RNA polymerase sigma-70 factor (ECF subfamily)